MADEWYYKMFGQEFGPVPFEEIAELAQSRKLSPNDPIRQGSDGEWVPGGSVVGLFPEGAEPEELQDLSELNLNFVDASEPEELRDLAELDLTFEDSSAQSEVDRVAEPELATGESDALPGAVAPDQTTTAPTDTEWYCQVFGQQMGPMPFEDVKQMAKHGELAVDDLVKPDANAEWVRAASIHGLYPGVNFSDPIVTETPAPSPSDDGDFQFSPSVAAAPVPPQPAAVPHTPPHPTSPTAVPPTPAAVPPGPAPAAPAPVAAQSPFAPAAQAPGMHGVAPPAASVPPAAAGYVQPAMPQQPDATPAQIPQPETAPPAAAPAVPAAAAGYGGAPAPAPPPAAASPAPVAGFDGSQSQPVAPSRQAPAASPSGGWDSGGSAGAGTTGTSQGADSILKNANAAAIRRPPPRKSRSYADESESLVDKIKDNPKAVALICVVALAVGIYYFPKNDGTQEYYDQLLVFQNEYQAMKVRNASASEYGGLKTRAESELAPMLEELDKRASAENKHLQDLLWAGRDFLGPMLSDAAEGKTESTNERQFMQSMESVRVYLSGGAAPPPAPIAPED